MSATESRIEANRANAAHSTGPRTPEGKAASAQNNLRHGLTGAFCVLPSEDLAAFHQLLADYRAEHNPQTPTERDLVEDMVRHRWLSQRAIALQEAAFTDPESDEKKFSLYLRYQTTHQRAFHRCVQDLLKLRKQKASEQRGFESQQRAQAVQERRQAAEARRARKDEWDEKFREAELEFKDIRYWEAVFRKEHARADAEAAGVKVDFTESSET